MSSPTRLAAGALVRQALRGEAALALPHLLVRGPGGVERAVALPAELTVGRGPDAGLVLADERASRLHARIRLAEDGSAAVEDLGSKNGLWLNDRALPGGPAPLRSGDEIRVGLTRLRFQDPLGEATAAEGPATGGMGGGAAVPAVTGEAGPCRGGGRPPPLRAPALLAGAAALLGLAALLLASG